MMDPLEQVRQYETMGRGNLHVVASPDDFSQGSEVPGSLPEAAWRPRRLPTLPGTLVGRAWEQVTVRQTLLREEVRLLTLWGPAGVGKTRLALAVASHPDLQAAFQDGVVFVDLAPVRDPRLVMPALAEALGVSESEGEDGSAADGLHRVGSDRLRVHLRDRRVLLVLDNLEQVLDAAPLLAPLLVDCPRVKLLTTSRAALRLRWEHAFPLAPLGIPERRLPNDADSAAAYAAVALFVERAQAARPDFRLTDANARVVAELCVGLDGLPLAIELAAARSKSLPLLALTARLDNRLALLEAGAPDLPVRQQTLRATLDWSYALLSPDQQALLRQMSVFVDGCSPEAAAAVCATAWVDADVLAALAGLIDLSLLRLADPTGAHARYRMLLSIRDYASEQLTRSGEAEDTRRRHAEYYLALAETAEPWLSATEQSDPIDRLQTEQSDRVDRLKAEHGNLQAALDWAIERGAAPRPRAARVLAHLGQLSAQEYDPALEHALQPRGGDDVIPGSSARPEAVVVASYPQGFTPREREVVEVAVRGYSNRDIATRLVISRRTAEGHIHSILTKLRLDSRAQLAVWGARHGLLPIEPDQ